jgi:translation initiation factor 1
MSKKNKPDKSGFVFSTDPSFSFEHEDNEIHETLLPDKQKLKISLETKHRAGKAVTLVTGFIGRQEVLEKLSRELKASCGTGGSSKDGEIIIQGDQREKIRQYLLKKGYGVK